MVAVEVVGEVEAEAEEREVKATDHSHVVHTMGGGEGRREDHVQCIMPT